MFFFFAYNYSSVMKHVPRSHHRLIIVMNFQLLRPLNANKCTFYRICSGIGDIYLHFLFLSPCYSAISLCMIRNLHSWSKYCVSPHFNFIQQAIAHSAGSWQFYHHTNLIFPHLASFSFPLYGLSLKVYSLTSIPV